MLNEPVTISFMGTKELRDLLAQWCEEDDRSMSYVIRKILEEEAERRALKAQAQEEKNGH